MSTPRKHHYLPQFYLENFRAPTQSGKKPQIFQISKEPSPSHHRAAIADTACIRDYHTVELVDGSEDHKRVETALARIEALNAKVLTETLHTKALDVSSLSDLRAFISLMRYRVPSFGKYIEASLRKVVLDGMQLMMASGKVPPPPPELQALLDRDGVEKAVLVEIQNWKVLEQMFQLAFAPESLQALERYSYHLFSAPPTSEFITSDNPVSIFHPTYQKIAPYGVGLATPDVELAMPLSSQVLLVAGVHIVPGSTEASDDQVREFNRRTITMAEKYIFAPEAPISLIEQIASLHSASAGFQFDSLLHGDGSVHISRFVPVQ